MGKRKSTHAVSDQFGEYGAGQDREDQFASLGRGRNTGGGTAGASSRKGADLSFQRHVPKFLQPYAHMLGTKRQDEDEPVVVGQEEGEEEQQQAGGRGRGRRRTQQGSDDDDDDGGDGGDAEAIQRALEENPALAAELGEAVVKRVRAAQDKEEGNKAFAAKKYEAAVACFTRCVELDPGEAVYWSNRSAALAALSKFDEALDDADKVVALKPRWVKGHARRAAALLGLQCYGDAKEAYERALKLEPDDATLSRGRDKAVAMELQHMRENKHVYKRHRPTTTGVKLGQAKPAAREAPSGGGASGGRQPPAAGVRAKGLLSFGGEEEEEG